MDRSQLPASAAAANRVRLFAVFLITLAIFGVELAGGIVANSLALISDAGHMFTDVAGIGLALAAIWFASRPPTRDRTFGYLRLEILAAVANALLLLGVAAVVLVEAWRRFFEPPVITTDLMVGVAFVGFSANAVSLFLLRHAQRESLNLRAAYLEVMGDLASSAAVIGAALAITLTGWTAADAVASVGIGLLIVPRTWRLLREAIDILLEATPKGVDLALVRRHILETPGVEDVHDLHAWAITSGLNAVSAHVVLTRDADPARVLDDLCRCLAGDFDVEHSTFQLELPDRRAHERLQHA